MRICAWPCGQAQTPLLLRPSYDEERRRSRRTEGRPLSLSVQFSTARNVQFSAGVDTWHVVEFTGYREPTTGLIMPGSRVRVPPFPPNDPLEWSFNPSTVRVSTDNGCE